MASRRRSKSKSRCRPGYKRISYMRNGKRISYCRKVSRKTSRKTSRRKASRKRTTSRRRKRTTSRRRKRTTSRRRKRKTSRPRTKTVYVYGAPPATTVYYQAPAGRSPPRRPPARAPTVTKVGVCNGKGYYSCDYSPMCQWVGTKNSGMCRRK